jgi:thiol-disulfide isomerase/thioredoxin
MFRKWMSALGALCLACAVGCGAQGGGHAHGRMSSMSTASKAGWKACPHGVPEEVCVKCKPSLAKNFKAKGDNPDLDFSPPKEPPKAADVQELVKEGEDVPSLEPHRVSGKVTIFDFYATWCPPCRKVDEHLYPIAEKQSDIAIRRLNVVSWDTPLAERYIKDVPELPYLVIYGRDGRLVEKIYGAKFAEIDKAIAEARR